MDDQFWILALALVGSAVAEVVKARQKKKKKMQAAGMDAAREVAEGAPVMDVAPEERKEGEGKKASDVIRTLLEQGEEVDVFKQIKQVVKESAKQKSVAVNEGGAAVQESGRGEAYASEVEFEDVELAPEQEGVGRSGAARQMQSGAAAAGAGDAYSWLGAVPTQEGGEGLAARRAAELREEELARQAESAWEHTSIGREAVQDIKRAVIATIVLEPKFKQSWKR